MMLCVALHDVSNESFKTLKLVVICEIIPETWLARVRSLLASSCGLRVRLLFLSWLSRCKPDSKKRVLGSDPQRDSHLKEIQLDGPGYRMRTKALQHRLMHVRSHVFPIRHGHRCY